MLKIFRTDIYTQIVIILAVSLTLWVGVFVNPRPLPMVGGGQLYYWLTGWLSPLVGAIIAYLLVLFEGFLLNGLLYRHKIITQNTFLPMLFYIIAMSLDTLTLTPVLLGSLFLVLTIDRLMLTNTLLSLPLDKIFSASACIALATLFCPAMAVFFIPLIICMFNYSLYGWRDWTMVILGAFAPYIIMETFLFVTDQMFYRNYLILYSLTDIDLRVDADWADWIASLIFILMLGIGTAYLNSQNRTINFKKNSSSIMIFLIGSLFYTLYTYTIPIPTPAFAIPFACCTASLFAEPKRKESGSNLIFVLLTAIFIAWRFL